MLQFKLHKKLTIILSSLKYRYRGKAVVNSCEFIFLDLFIGLHNILLLYIIYGLLDDSARKNLPAMQETWFSPWVGNIPWRREWQLTSTFLAGEFHGQRSLVGYSTWGRKESDMIEWPALTVYLNFKFYWVSYNLHGNLTYAESWGNFLMFL